VSAARGRGRPRPPAVAVALRDGVAWLTLDRATTGNTLDAEMMGGLAEACELVEHDDAVRVIVLAAAGRDFCVGLPRAVAWPPASWPDGASAVARLTKPVVACVGGAVRGWGLALALACDLRVLASDTVLVLADVPRGRLPGGGVTQRLARIVGPSRALAMLLLAEPVDARTAVAWGLGSRVVPASRLRATGTEVASALAERAPLAMRLAKEAVVRALDLPLDEGARLEHDLYVLLQTTTDRTEGVRSFLERRPPRYQGR
jgi:enoyl-CoA hydratase/carnithine racemase